MPKGQYDYSFEADDPDVRAVNEGSYEPPASRNAATGEYELDVSNPELYTPESFGTRPKPPWYLWAVGAYIAWKVFL